LYHKLTCIDIAVNKYQ